MFGLNDDGTARLIYMLLFLAFIGSGLFSYRNRLSETLRYALIWVGVFSLLVIGYAYRAPLLSFAGPVFSELNPSRPFEVTEPDGARSLIVTRSENGHFTLTAQVNGVDITFLVDTGASVTALTYSDADAVGLQPRSLTFNRPVQTANGLANEAVTTIRNFDIGPFRLRDMPIGVADQGHLTISLLGIDVLNRFKSWRVEGERLILTPDI